MAYPANSLPTTPVTTVPPTTPVTTVPPTTPVIPELRSNFRNPVCPFNKPSHSVKDNAK